MFLEIKSVQCKYGNSTYNSRSKTCTQRTALKIWNNNDNNYQGTTVIKSFSDDNNVLITRSIFYTRYIIRHHCKLNNNQVRSDPIVICI